MNRKNLFRNKAVITSLFAVSMMCLASTAVPLTASQNNIDFIKNGKNLSYKNSLQERLLSLVNSQDELSIHTILSIARESISNLPRGKRLIIESAILNLERILPKQDFIVPKQDFESLLISTLLDSKSTWNSNLEILRQLEKKIDLSNYDSFFERDNKYMDTLKPNLDEDYGFYGKDGYWNNYENALGFWMTQPEVLPNYPFIKILDILPIHNNDNYVEWWDGYINSLQFVGGLIAGLITVGSLILILASPEPDGVNMGLNAIGSLLIIIGGYIAGGYMFYTFMANTQFTWLLNKEVDMYVRFIDNNTKKGITNLAEEQNYIKARNLDAINSCDGSRGKQEGDFIYYLKPDEDFKVNETGWYSLNARAETIDEKYVKPPCPPGNWSIEIFADGYEPIETLTPSIHSSESILIGTIALVPEE